MATVSYSYDDTDALDDTYTLDDTHSFDDTLEAHTFTDYLFNISIANYYYVINEIKKYTLIYNFIIEPIKAFVYVDPTVSNLKRYVLKNNPQKDATIPNDREVN